MNDPKRHDDMVKRLMDLLALLQSRKDALGMVCVVLLPNEHGGHNLESRYAVQQGAQLPMVGSMDLVARRLGDLLVLGGEQVASEESLPGRGRMRLEDN